MSELSKQEIKALKAQAHHLKPVVLLGDKGLTEAVQKEIGVALAAHELVKIRISADDHEQRDASIKAICEHHGATLIQQMGHMATVYKKKES
jgi:RNA-binding protein